LDGVGDGYSHDGERTHASQLDQGKQVLVVQRALWGQVF
jgi:hypothetical protein